jgi:putative redox protein
MDSRVIWKRDMAFDAQLEGLSFSIDADEKFGGTGQGPKPKGLTLTSVAGCTAMDVIAILKKMRVTVDGFSVEAKGSLAEEHPITFTKIVLEYYFLGEDLPVAKLRRAVELSQTRYCGVIATLRPSVAIEGQIYLNGDALD